MCCTCIHSRNVLSMYLSSNSVLAGVNVPVWHCLCDCLRHSVTALFISCSVYWEVELNFVVCLLDVQQ